MKIKIIKSCFGNGFNYSAGDTAEVADKLGKELVSLGFANEIKQSKPKKEIKPVGGANADA